MRILIHDFAGHPFQIQLSRELASRGHRVTHAYPVGLQGPKGNLEPGREDSDKLEIKGIRLSNSFKKYSPLARFISQRRYARDLKSLISGEAFDVVISGNTPIDVQAELLWRCRRSNVAFVHWVQDIYSRALEFFLRRQGSVLAEPIGFAARWLEICIARYSSANVVVSSAFKELLLTWKVAPGNISVVENWSPLEEVAVVPRDNAWARAHNLVGQTVFLYAGTLGMKHRPDLLYRLAQNLGDDCRVVVVSEGTGRDYLERQPPLPNLNLLDFQPYERISEVYGSADVLVATLESSAGVFAVPSKVLSYLCAQRVVLFASPADNLASIVVRNSGGGITVDPDNADEFVRCGRILANDPARRARCAAQGRAYAENTFDIRRIAGLFEDILFNAGATAPIALPAKTAVPSN